jgi:hypothetical protein
VAAGTIDFKRRKHRFTKSIARIRKPRAGTLDVGEG